MKQKNLNNGGIDMEVRVMSLEEKEKLNKENFETEEKEKEVVVSNIFRNDQHSLMYAEDTYRLEKKYQDKVPHRITLFKIFDIKSLHLSIGIDAVLATGAIQLYGEMLKGRNNLVFYPYMTTEYNEENYDKTSIYKSLFNIFTFTELSDKEQFLKEIIMTMKKIAGQLSILSFKYNHSNVIHSTMDDSDMKKNFELLMSKTPTKTLPYFGEEIEVNVCTPDNVVYPLYYSISYKEDKNLCDNLPNTITPSQAIFENKKVVLAREDRYDLTERDLLMYDTFHRTEMKSIISVNSKSSDYYKYSYRDRLAIRMIQQLPTTIIELALALKRVFGEKTTMCKGEYGKGIGIYNSGLGLTVKLVTTKDKNNYYQVEYRNSTEGYNFLIDTKDLLDVLRILIKYHNNTTEVLQSDLILIHEYITTNITPTTFDYDLWYTRRAINDNYNLRDYNEEDEEDQYVLVKNNMLDEMMSLIKYSTYKGESILYNMDVNDEGELFVLVHSYFEDIRSREMSGIVKRNLIQKVNSDNKDLHGTFISFKVCLEDETIVFSPIKNNVFEQYTENIQSMRLFNDEQLKGIIEPITEGVFMDMIHKYIEYCKETDMEDVFKIK